MNCRRQALWFCLDAAVSDIIGTAIAPLILYGTNSIIQYVQPLDEMVEGAVKTVYQVQSESTKIKLLFTYTVLRGLVVLVGCAPYLFYRLTGARREQMHEAVLEHRALLEASGEGVVTQKE